MPDTTTPAMRPATLQDHIDARNAFLREQWPAIPQRSQIGYAEGALDSAGLSIPTRGALPAADYLAVLNAALADAQLPLAPRSEADAYLLVLQDRATRFASHLAAMPFHADMLGWATEMAARYGEFVRVYWYIADWRTALLIIRHGEEPDPARTTDGHAWPSAWGTEDVQRALSLLPGPAGNRRWPEFLHLLPREVPVTPTTTEGITA
jgi:hypothetical protein